MPNGGSDCCRTCWFNSQNGGKFGYVRGLDLLQSHCTIRDIAIEDPFYTYCGNHPHRRPDRDPIPIGPIFIAQSEGRTVWQNSPDTEEVRQHLLDLLLAIEEEPTEEYPTGVSNDELIVWQLGEFSETLAKAGLQRIAEFSPKASGGRFGRTREGLVELALLSLKRIHGNN